MDSRFALEAVCGLIALLLSALYARSSVARTARATRVPMVGGYAASAAAFWLLAAAHLIATTSNRGMAVAVFWASCATGGVAAVALVIGITRLLRGNCGS